MATVWLARDLKHDRLVAIKLLRPELAAPVGAERFAREIGIVAKLNHPNILPVLDSGIVEIEGLSAPYYVMPHVEGPSLSTLLNSGEKLEVSEALRLAGEVADALAFAHSRGIVHRDIKPGNILIQAGHALVADFGVAIALDAVTVSRAHPTRAGEVLGTPVYMSPEQASGESRLDGRSDVYSLGCVLYEMLAGTPPFNAITPQSMLIAHLSTPPPPLAARRPGLPAGVPAAVHRALEKDPGDRYASAGEFRDALDRLRTPAGTRKAWWPMLAAAVALLVLAWWSPWRHRGEAPAGEAVVLLTGFRDPSGSLRAEAAALDDALRLELQAVPGLRVVDVGDLAEMPTDTLRARYGADWIIRGAVDRVNDSVGATVRVLNASDGSEVKSAVVRLDSAAQLQAAATALGPGSLFGSVRYALNGILLDRWLFSLGTDTATSELRSRARQITTRAIDALPTIGPRRMLDELAVADSLLALAQKVSPASALPPYERTRLAVQAGFLMKAGHQFFPDSTWIPAPLDAFRRALPFANEAVRRAPQSADAWFARSDLLQWLFTETHDPAWRDSALGDLRRATTIAGGRADIWTLRAEMEQEAGLFAEALFSVEQGEAADHLHVYARRLRYHRAVAEMGLGRFKEALADCRWGASHFPEGGYFTDCEAQVLGMSSNRPADAAQLDRLADSLVEHGLGGMTPIMPDQLRLYAASILARSGQLENARRRYGLVVDRWQGGVAPDLLLDAAYAQQEIGDLDSALAIAARAVQLDSVAGQSAERQPRFTVLMRHPGFPEAMKGIPPKEAKRR